MKKLFLVILALILMTGCSLPTGLVKIEKTYSHLFIVYLDGDNNLEKFFIDDLNSMEYALYEYPSENVKIIAMLDTSGGPAKVFEVSADDDLFSITSKVISEPGEVSMGDPQVLENFVIFALNNYRAKHYYLVFGDHGNGVEGLCEDESSEVGKDGWGAPEYDWLTLNELKSALQNVKEKTKVTFDIIGFDCCLMATIEVAYAIKDYGRIMVASQDVEYAPGWFWESILSEVLLNPKIQPEDLAKTIVKKYSVNHCETDRTFTLSAIDLSKIPSLIPPLCKISQYLTDVLNKEKDNNFTGQNLLLTEITTKIRDNPQMRFYEYADMYELIKQLEEMNLPLEVNQSVGELKNALSSAINELPNRSKLRGICEFKTALIVSYVP